MVSYKCVNTNVYCTRLFYVQTKELQKSYLLGKTSAKGKTAGAYSHGRLTVLETSSTVCVAQEDTSAVSLTSKQRVGNLYIDNCSNLCIEWNQYNKIIRGRLGPMIIGEL